jgi:hypothetical protein
VFKRSIVLRSSLPSFVTHRLAPGAFLDLEANNLDQYQDMLHAQIRRIVACLHCKQRDPELEIRKSKEV